MPRTNAADVTISVYSRTRRDMRRCKYRQWRSVQSIIGAMESLDCWLVSIFFVYLQTTGGGFCYAGMRLDTARFAPVRQRIAHIAHANTGHNHQDLLRFLTRFLIRREDATRVRCHSGATPVASTGNENCPIGSTGTRLRVESSCRPLRVHPFRGQRSVSRFAPTRPKACACAFVNPSYSSLRTTGQ